MNRYPGIRPFRSDERHLFFGRDQDIERLHRLIGLEQVVILYGKSGYGKSSLLQAGVLPRIAADDDIQAWEIRLGPCKPGESLPPADTLRQTLARGLGRRLTVPADLAGPSLWQTLKNYQTPQRNRFLLVFDQFEEIFTYPPAQILDFKQQLAEALFSLVPDRYARAFARSEAAQDPAARTRFFAPLELKVVFSIRADRMSLLHQLKDYLPNLLQHAYLLDALDEGQATEAVVKPASLQTTPNPTPEGRGGVEDTVEDIVEDTARAVTSPLPSGEGSGVGLPPFSTPPFSYTPEALRLIFNELRDQDTGKIETSALQIVCKHVEDNIVAKKQSGALGAPMLSITPADLGDLKSIFRAFYDNTIAALPPGEQRSARHLVEDVLIKDGIRLPFAEQALLTEPGVSAGLLEKLERASLLRVELDEQRRKIYEVGHDTLVAPIEEAAKARRDEEEKERLQQEAEAARLREEEALRREREAERRRRRATLLAWGAGVAALLAVAASVLAFQQTRAAEKAQKEAVSQTEMAKKQKGIAENALRQADDNLKLAKREEARAKEALLQVEKEKAATDAQRRVAEQNFQIAQQKTKEAEAKAEEARVALQKVEETTVQIVQNLLRNASTQVYHLRYDDAVETLHDAVRLVADKPADSPLGRLRPALADSLLEPAYFYAETEQYAEALIETGIAANLLGLTDPTADWHDPLADQKNWTPTQRKSHLKAFRAALQKLRPDRFTALEQRYYPLLLRVPGGKCKMSNTYTPQLSAFQLARTEATFFQWAVHAAATHQKITNFSPSWGLDGDNPVVNVSWYDAVVYANWLSERAGLETVYEIDSVGKEQYSWTVVCLEKKNGFRLPTEAEWQYAATNAGQDTTDYAGSKNLDEVGWYDENSAIDGVYRTHPVAGKKPNGLGLYDLSGNVMEWCLDWYDDYPSGSPTNPIGPVGGSYRVLRGGSWYDVAVNARVGVRSYSIPRFRRGYYGLRLARTVNF